MSRTVRLIPSPSTWIPGKGTIDTSHLHDEAELRELAVENPFRPSEGYRIHLSEHRIDLEVGSPSAARYAWDHLRQLQGEDPAHTPCGELVDAPAFSRRAFMLDISRDKVPIREGLLLWLGLLRAFRYNELQLYTEHTFAYTGHETVWKDASPVTGEDLEWLQQEAAALGIELVPNQNTFGHFERWIKHEAYRPFAEAPDGFITPWGDTRTVGSVLKPDDASFELVSGLLDQLLPHFASHRVNIGCDETFELGQGRSKELCEQDGMGTVYAKFVSRIMTYVQEAHGKRPEFWGDIILKYPEELHRLPQEAVALDWGYEADAPFAESCQTFAQSGLKFAVCPGTSSWTSFAGRTENMIGNLRNAIGAGQKEGAEGVILTDWGDHGHLQQEMVSYPALALNGLFAWEGLSADLERAWQWCDQAAFEGNTGDTACWLAAGRISDLSGIFPVNRNQLFNWFMNPQDPKGLSVSNEQMNEMQTAIDHLPTPVCYREEWEQTLRNMRLCVARVLDARTGTSTADSLTEQAKTAHAALWRRRNREGGLAESLQRYSKTPNRNPGFL